MGVGGDIDSSDTREPPLGVLRPKALRFMAGLFDWPGSECAPGFLSLED